MTADSPEEPVDPAPHVKPVKPGDSVLPTSPQFEDFLKLIERDNPELYRKLMNLD